MQLRVVPYTIPQKLLYEIDPYLVVKFDSNTCRVGDQSFNPAPMIKVVDITDYCCYTVLVVINKQDNTTCLMKNLMNTEEITFKLLSGEIVKNHLGTFYFNRPGNNMHKNGWPINKYSHREDGPAVEYTNGLKTWYVNGKLHRTDGPAMEYASGEKHWFIDELNVSIYDSRLKYTI